MKSAAPLTEPRRPYRQTARAAAAEATAERILDAFTTRLEAGWFDEVRLEDVAQDAGVTVQTVIRRFGGKEGLLQASYERLGRIINSFRETVPGDAAGCIRTVIADYEARGDLVMRNLAQEDRYPAVRRMADLGRAAHRTWIAAVFAPWLERLEAEPARRTLDALVVATDVYVWKLVRRDMGRPVAELAALMERLVAAALGLSALPRPETNDGQD